MVVSNRRVLGLYGGAAVDSLRSAGFEVFVCLIGDGERFKNLRSLEKVLAFLSENKISPDGRIVALGGGVVGDLAGFAASVYMSRSDTSAGADDAAVDDRFVGRRQDGGEHAERQEPRGHVLPAVGSSDRSRGSGTLPRREITAGLCEAVKQAAFAGGQTVRSYREFLSAFDANDVRKSFDDAFVGTCGLNLIAGQVAFKAKIVAATRHEDPATTDASSRKILNFGHTFAHALEK